MSWLRIDDGFADHPKIGRLTDRQFRVWIKTLCYCARYRDPTIDEATTAAIRGLDASTVARFFELGLLDNLGDSHVVHDWEVYAPRDSTGAERQAKWRASGNGSRNGSVTPDVTGRVTEDVTL